MSKIIPNTFQNPNVYVDKYMAFLTPNEFKVLSYATRRIIGFDKTEDRISIGQFSGGLFKKDGTRLDWGTGLSEPAVRVALNGLVKCGLMVVTQPHIPQENLPPAFSLQWDIEKVDQAGLEARLEEKQKKDKNKTRNLRVPPVSGIDPVSPIDPVSETDPPRLVPLTPPGQWDSTHNNPVKNQGKPVKLSNDNAPPPLTEGLRFTLLAFGRKRFGNEIQKDAVSSLETVYGTDRLKEVITWAAKKGMGLGEAIPAVEKAIVTWGKPKAYTNGNHAHAPPAQAAWTPAERAAARSAAPIQTGDDF